MNEPPNDIPPPQPLFLRFLFEKMMPRARQVDLTGDLDERFQPVLGFARDSVFAVAEVYKDRVIEAFNRTAFLLEIAAVVFCFGAASSRLSVVVVLVAVLGALTLRDAYTHPDEDSVGTASQYYLDSAGDAAATAVFLLASQALMRTVLPSLTLPRAFLFRGALVCLPLLSTMRMVLRPAPNKRMPFEGSNKSAEAIYRMTWRLNILWMTACCVTILTNPDAMPASIPGHDFLLVLIPLLTFGMWIRLQQDALPRDRRIETVIGDWKKKERARKRETLMKGLEKRDPLYRGYTGLQVLFFLLLAAPVAVGLWPWLSGREADVDFYRLGFSLGTLVTVVLSWNYVKNSNRAAASALETEKDPPPWTGADEDLTGADT